MLTDSGGNSLLRVQGGHVSTIATFDTPGIAPVPFPPFAIPVDAVPDRSRGRTRRRLLRQ